MNPGFEITPEDVAVVLSSNGRDCSEDEAERIFNEIILPVEARITEAALSANVMDSDEETLDNQTNAAHQEILAVLQEAGTI